MEKKMIRKDTNEIIFSRDEIETMIAKHLATHGDTKDIQLSQKKVEFDFQQGSTHQINFDRCHLIIRDKK